MKKGIFFIILFAAILPGCKEDVPTVFAEPDGIYFSAPADSMTYTFAKYPNRLSDTLKIPVTVLGKAADKDRTITLEKLSGTDINGTEGVHYKLLQPYTLPAGKVSTTLPVVIYRTGDMDSLSFNFKFQLKANENFVSGISVKTSLKIKVGYLQKPPTWGTLSGLSQWAGQTNNFGTWTKTKYKIILNALYDQVSDSTVTEFPSLPTFPAAYAQYLQIVKNYIRTNYPGNYSTPLGVGATLRDPDMSNNPVIQVGPSNY